MQQEELTDLIRDLNLSQEAAEILASRLKDVNWLGTGVSTTFYRTREHDSLPYFYFKNYSSKNLFAVKTSKGFYWKWECHNQRLDDAWGK